MTPIPEQIAEWRGIARLMWFEDNSIDAIDGHKNCYIAGYVKARTEQATEIAELKAKLAEVVTATQRIITNANGDANTGYFDVPVSNITEAKLAIEQLLKD